MKIYLYVKTFYSSDVVFDYALNFIRNLDILKNTKSDFISGEEISDTLKISRQALWKRL